MSEDCFGFEYLFVQNMFGIKIIQSKTVCRKLILFNKQGTVASRSIRLFSDRGLHTIRDSETVAMNLIIYVKDLWSDDTFTGLWY